MACRLRGCMQLTVVVQQGQGEAQFRALLVEDAGAGGARSYTEHLMAVHKAVLTMMYVGRRGVCLGPHGVGVAAGLDLPITFSWVTCV